MSKKTGASLLIFVFSFVISACTESRRDPCELLTELEVKAVDPTIENSQWAGKEGGKLEDEVCIYSAANGDPKVMLFVWYDKNKDPGVLFGDQSAGGDFDSVPLPGVGLWTPWIVIPG